MWSGGNYGGESSTEDVRRIRGYRRLAVIFTVVGNGGCAVRYDRY